MRAKSFYITTFGCQMNEHDSEIMAGLLEKAGLQEAQSLAAADIAIFNTCSVRENADKRFFGTLGTLKHRKEEDPHFLVCVGGCMMQQEHIVASIKQKYPWVDIVFGTHSFQELPALLERAEREEEQREETEEKRRIPLIDVPEEALMPEELPAKRLYHHKSLVNIMYGCNNFCTYCIVPYTRGREKSRAPGAIIREIEGLAADGVREVMLLGQNVNSYQGKEEGAVTSFAALIRRVNAVEGIRRIRFMTSHPKDLSPELIDAFQDCDTLCPQIHLPVQSGSDAVLQKMNRRYTAEAYMDLIRRLREKVPDIAISTDIIVGFPGETEEDFQKTLELVDKVEYDSAFTFIYSPRRGTPAAEQEDQVEEAVKHRRLETLSAHVNRISLKKNRALRGSVQEVLVDGRSKRDAAMLTGRTPGFKLVNFAGPLQLTGTLQKVRITDAKTFSLRGELI